MIFLDTNVFMYAAGTAHPYKNRCLKLLERVAKSPSAHEHCTNTEVLQEILHRYRAINLEQIGFELFDLVINLGLIIHPIELQDLKIAKKILREYPKLSTRDAVHIGMMIRRDINTVISYDGDFSVHPAITRVEP